MYVDTKIATHEQLQFLTPSQANQLAEGFGSPLFVYSKEVLTRKAQEALAFQAPFGLTVRYAMKANPLAAILNLFNSLGLHIDASSGFEVARALDSGIPASHIMLTSQQLPNDLAELVRLGVKFNATSLHQLDTYGRLGLSAPLSIRINAGVGSGYRRGVSVAGPGASFGIWHEHTDQIHDLIRKYGLVVDTLHSHIGCGSDPTVWREVTGLTLELVDKFPSVTTVNLGGGFKVARMNYESPTDLPSLGRHVAKLVTDFANTTSRRLKLEIEPGTFLTANAGSLIATVQDMADTGPGGYRFLKLDTGMNDIMRPALHAGQHPIIIINNRPQNMRDYVVVGHNCESSDLLTPSPDDAEIPLPRRLQEASIGDLAVIEGVGAYCSAMRLTGYNSFPTPAEVLVATDGSFELIRRPGTVHDLQTGEVVSRG